MFTFCLFQKQLNSNYTVQKQTVLNFTSPEQIPLYNKQVSHKTCCCREGVLKWIALSECMPWKYGDECANDCLCNMTNSDLCNTVSGRCDCKTGWSGETCDDDIDECLEETSCPNISVCINSNGSFSCKCNTGYLKTRGGICQGMFTFKIKNTRIHKISLCLVLEIRANMLKRKPIKKVIQILLIIANI